MGGAGAAPAPPMMRPPRGFAAATPFISQQFIPVGSGLAGIAHTQVVHSESALHAAQHCACVCPFSPEGADFTLDPPRTSCAVRGCAHVSPLCGGGAGGAGTRPSKPAGKQSNMQHNNFTLALKHLATT